MANANKKSGLREQLTGSTRFIATIPVIGLFISAVVMTVATFVRTIYITIEAITLQIEMQQMLVEYIEFADYFLLSIVLYIMSIGLYSLFIDSHIKLPSWLEVHTLDDLKEKLVSVVIVVMGVFFLGKLLLGADAKDLLYLGFGIGAVILALAYFVRHVMGAHGDLGEETGESECVEAKKSANVSECADSEENGNTSKDNDNGKRVDNGAIGGKIKCAGKNTDAHEEAK